MPSSSDSGQRFLPAFFVLLFLILIIYSNSFSASFHFDDIPQIVNNARIHLETFSLEGIGRALGAFQNRPLSSLSLALNWYVGQKQVFGYHAVNIAIHIGCAFLLFLACRQFLHSPGLRGRYTEEDSYFIALLAAVLWAVNPVQVQAVTYIVQRMASLCALFYILSLLCFMRARATDEHHSRIRYGIGCVACFLGALGSKENAILLPFALVLVEVVCYRPHLLLRPKPRHLWLGIAGLMAAVTIVFLFTGGKPVHVVSNYANRPFTLVERVLTQPRVILFYLSQLFYPVAERLSIAHDVAVSTSLFKPWSTLPAILVNLSLVGGGLWRCKKYPIVSFAILFFFLNHILESTIVPLEMVFEHRNYLPSMFLFLPVAAGLQELLRRYRQKRVMFLLLCTATTFLITAVAMGTYNRNWLWANETALWRDAVNKAPGSARVYHNLALGYQRAGKLHEAMRTYKIALASRGARTDTPAYVHNNMGGIYFGWEDYPQAAWHLQKALEINPKYRSANYLLTVALIKLGAWQAAEKNLDLFLADYMEREGYLSLKGFLLLKRDRPREAISYFRKGVRLAYNSRDSLIDMGVAMGRLGAYNRAYWFLTQANAIYRRDPFILLCMVDNRIQAEDPKAAAIHADAFIDVVGMKRIESFLSRIRSDNLVVPINYASLVPFVSARVKSKALDYVNMADRIKTR